MSDSAFEQYLREELDRRFQAKLDEYTCPDCRILACVLGQGRPFCGLCGYDAFPPFAVEG